MEEEDFEDDPKSDLHVLRQELEKSITTEADTAETLPAESTPDLVEENQNRTIDVRGRENDGKGKHEDHGEGEAIKGKKVSKKFGKKFYSGEVVSFDPETHWYKVAYEDGDAEELWWWELRSLLVQPRSTSKKRTRAEAEEKLHGKRTRKERESSEGVTTQEDAQKVLQAGSEETANKKNSGGLRKRSRKREASISGESDEMTMLEEAPVDSVNQMTLRTRSLKDSGLGFRLLGKETRKNIDGKVYYGKIVDFDPEAKYYKISYEDGDEEELSWSELMPMLLSANEKTSKGCVELASGHGHDDVNTMKPDKAAAQKFVLNSIPLLYKDKYEPEKTLSEQRKADMVSLVPHKHSSLFHPALHASRFTSSENADNLEYFGWGEVVAFDKLKCPELQAVKILPTASSIVHLAASQHHLAALTAAGQVFVWRNRHGNIRERTNQWEHISDLDNKSIVLIDIAGPDLNRSSAGYTPSQEDQVPDPFHLVAVSYGGRDYVFQGSQHQEPVHTYPLVGETRLYSLEELLRLNDTFVEKMGRIVQVSVGSVAEIDEPPYIGYITDSDHVFIRSATKNYVEEVNKVTGFTGRPLKIQCGKAYHAIIMTDNGCAWTWGLTGSARSLSVCQPAHDALVGQKVIDVGCCGEDFIALTDDGRVYQWTQGGEVTTVMIAADDRLMKVSISDGLSAGISTRGKLHTWRTFTGRSPRTPFGREEPSKSTAVSVLGKRSILKGICVTGSLVVVAKKPKKGRPGKSAKKNADEDE